MQEFILTNFGLSAQPSNLCRLVLTPDGDDATIVTEVFDCGTVTEEVRQSLLSDGGAWINGNNSMLESMTASLERLEKIIAE